jgi:hypothetical protein
MRRDDRGGRRRQAPLDRAPARGRPRQARDALEARIDVAEAEAAIGPDLDDEQAIRRAVPVGLVKDLRRRSPPLVKLVRFRARSLKPCSSRQHAVRPPHAGKRRF